MAQQIHLHLYEGDTRTRDYGVPGMKKGQREKSGVPLAMRGHVLGAGKKTSGPKFYK